MTGGANKNIMTMDTYMADNEKYIPGISTYGARGNTGKRGASGLSMYYSAYYNLSDKTSSYSSEVASKIRSNYLLSNNSLLSDDDSRLPEDREYQIGDTFVSPDGKVYMLKSITSSAVTFEFIGEITLS